MYEDKERELKRCTKVITSGFVKRNILLKQAQLLWLPQFWEHACSQDVDLMTITISGLFLRNRKLILG